MTQSALPFGSSDTMTYTDLMKLRAASNEKPRLLREIQKRLSLLAQGPSRKALDDLNDLSLDLEILDPTWREFSCACFAAVLQISFFSAARNYNDLVSVYSRTMQRDVF